MSQIFKAHVLKFFESEVGMEKQDDQLFDCLMRYAMIAYRSKQFMNKMVRVYGINLTFQNSFNVLKQFEKFNFID